MSGTFVSIGNGTQSFARLLDEIKAVADRLPQPVIVQHGRTPFESQAIEHFAFTDEDGFKRRLRDCDLFITHGGGGSVFAAIREAKRPVVVPRRKAFDEIVDDHQLAFTAELARQGNIEPVFDVGDLLAAVSRALANPLPASDDGQGAQAVAIIERCVHELSSDDSPILLVTPSGGHLSEMRSLAAVYEHRPHHFVINTPVVQTREMKGRTSIISLSQRDLKFFVNMWEAFQIMRREKPGVMLTTGGGFSVAFALIAKVFRIPVVYVETVAKVDVPTVTGRFMYYLADRFFYQWRQLERFFPKGRFIGLVL